MKPERIHCVGIGGIGVSALAQYYLAQGLAVSGSDLARSEITDMLKKAGAAISIGPHRSANLRRGVSQVIYTTATKSNNPELRAARKRSVPTRSYAEALGELTRSHCTVAIAGAHGKSTTTALTALTLIRGGLDPTVIIGTKLREFHSPTGGTNFRRGRSPILVIEADEYRAGFLNHTPEIAVVTNIDREHLDFYKNLRRIVSVFTKFLHRIPRGGTAILNRDDPHLRAIGRSLARKGAVTIRWYSLRDPVAAQIRKILRIPGNHNVSNALAAYAVGRCLGVPHRTILRALASYRGSWRRFDYQGIFSDAKVFADYAHHPTEIIATLAGTKQKFPKRRIVLVFQPHHYERTRDLFPEFTRAFGDADEVILLDIYAVAGREKSSAAQQVSSAKLAASISRQGINARYLSDPRRLPAELRRTLKRGDILLMMGAGSIWEMTKALISKKNRTI